MSKELQDEINNLIKTIHPVKKMDFAVKCVELVLPILEDSSDNGLRFAIETVKKYSTLSSQEIKEITDNESEKIFRESQALYKLAAAIEETPEGQAVYAIGNLLQLIGTYAFGGFYAPASMSHALSFIIKNIVSIDENNLSVAKKILDGILKEKE